MKELKIIDKIKTKVKEKLRGMCGIDKIREEIDSLYYIINKGIDITDFPKATGALREYQLADTELLRLFHEVCQKYQLTYWLDWGTLLGAVRHNGFIPWDDDLDVCMPREDFNKAKTMITQAFADLGFHTVVKNAIYIWHEKNGVALDIFAVDQTEDNGDVPALEKKAEQFYTYCLKNYEPKGWRDMEGVDDVRDEIMGKAHSKPVYYSAVETTGKLCVYSQEMIFPLKKHRFEQYEFMVPNQTTEYVKVQYSDYMSYPRNGILHHSNEGIHTYLRANMNHEDLNLFTEKMKEINFL